MRIAYFAHDLDDPAVARRIAMFRDAGAETLVFGFRRWSSSQFDSRAVGMVLGVTRNGRMVQRTLAVLLASRRMPDLAAELTDCDVLIARNLEMLALAVTSRGPRRSGLPIVYECLDIHRLLSGDRLQSRVLRLIEGRLLKRCQLLITSSERYLSEHYRKHYADIPPVLLVENKILASEIGISPRLDPSPRPPGPVWRVGWFGILRCRRTLLLLQQLALMMPDRIEIVIRGRPARDVIPDFDTIVSSAPAIHFGGPYDRGRDLRAIYESVDLVWAIDFYEAGGNSDWLLPNRLYESVLHGCVPVVSTASETGQWLRRRGFTHTLDDTASNCIAAFFASLTGDVVERARSELARIPYDDVVCDRDQARAVVDRLPRKRGVE